VILSLSFFGCLIVLVVLDFDIRFPTRFSSVFENLDHGDHYDLIASKPTILVINYFGELGNFRVSGNAEFIVQLGVLFLSLFP
jgi:hypothetical protein